MQAMWLDFQRDTIAEAARPAKHYTDPAKLIGLVESWYRQMPLAHPETQKRLWGDGLALWETVLGQYGIGPKTTDAQPGDEPRLPRSDRRFADARWREQPFFALIHQAYLMFAEQAEAMAEGIEGLEPAKQEQLRFLTRAILDALSPANFTLTNPVALDRAIETKGESLVKGLEHLLADLGRGQLTHTDPDAFKLGENIAVTPGKVVHEAKLYQLIQYTPTTENVLATPLVIFPPWINRFYILDLNPAKSFVRWAVAQGITVFMVSWKSADETFADVVWDDYIHAQIEAIDVVRTRLDVPSAHAIGYCVAGTTLAATLAVLARRGEADKVKSATFFTAQVDFEEPGDLKHFIDDQQIEAIAHLAPDGYLDGRYMAATFNLLRGNDLIWSYVTKNYLMGEDYPAFDLLHWNGDVTNLPAKWHCAYLRDLYRDNRLVVADSLSADGTPIDLRQIATPSFIQAGREDHIAPPESVWKLTHYLKGPWTFLLAGSGHIAGVVNPEGSKKYGYWTNAKPGETLDEFVAGAEEHAGSWWPHWLGWLRGQDAAEVKATGKRNPGGRGDKVIEDAPGRYVMER
ncbi:class I poly(R)-hydroxyalkanoic acid synthase [Novosphingobium sp. G106]|uniref:PHA/PHB synthase family protein n=1 Tax=Novosphingobium sp. G106 TaxID=2849500 RepID=UPI001C2DDCBA|nr:class I poly(R)-hydroxyalkanoic acid synthase [Novosphingobium sp. G106]